MNRKQCKMKSNNCVMHLSRLKNTNFFLRLAQHCRWTVIIVSLSACRKTNQKKTLLYSVYMGIDKYFPRPISFKAIDEGDSGRVRSEIKIALAKYKLRIRYHRPSRDIYACTHYACMCCETHFDCLYVLLLLSVFVFYFIGGDMWLDCDEIGIATHTVVLIVIVYIRQSSHCTKSEIFLCPGLSNASILSSWFSCVSLLFHCK